MLSMRPHNHFHSDGCMVASSSIQGISKLQETQQRRSHAVRSAADQACAQARGWSHSRQGMTSSPPPPPRGVQARAYQQQDSFCQSFPDAVVRLPAHLVGPT